MQDRQRVVSAVRLWLSEWVVGLDLCPFAAGPLRAGRVRIAVSEACDTPAALHDVFREVQHLLEVDAAEVETTLVALPQAWSGWEDFLDGVAAIEAVLEQSGLEADLQVVGFHPAYTFADAVGEQDPADRVNRAPMPIVHLLRGASVARAIESYPDTGDIPARNAELLRSGQDRVEAAWRRAVELDA